MNDTITTEVAGNNLARYWKFEVPNECKPNDYFGIVEIEFTVAVRVETPAETGTVVTVPFMMDEVISTYSEQAQAKRNWR